METEQDDWRDRARSVAPVWITFLVLVALAALLSALDLDFTRWELLLELIGAAVVLVGLYGICRRARAGEPVRVQSLLGDVVLVLGGGILVGGGWGAALGLGLVAAAGVLADRDRKDAGGDDAA